MKHFKRDFKSKAWVRAPWWPKGVGQRPKFNFLRIWSCCISNLLESRMQQHGSKYFVRRPPPPDQPPPPPLRPWRVGSKGQNPSFF